MKQFATISERYRIQNNRKIYIKKLFNGDTLVRDIKLRYFSPLQNFQFHRYTVSEEP